MILGFAAFSDAASRRGQLQSAPAAPEGNLSNANASLACA
jgi:hypothetical protein